MVHIYNDTNVCTHHISHLGLPSYSDIDEFLALIGSKIAIFHVPFPYDRGEGSALELRLKRVIDHCDRVILLASELHDCTTTLLLDYKDHPKVKFFICGHVDHIKYNFWMDWFITSTYFYKQNTILDSLKPYQAKPKTFDILLGQMKPHRTMLYNYIKLNHLDNRVIMSYLGENRFMTPGQDTDGFKWEEEGLEILDNDVRFTVTQVKYFGQQMSLSQVVPIRIFNETAYSVVAETNYNNHYSFFTEKIVKPILAKRLFIVFSGKNYLRNLRSLGFKTFDGIIDESYDQISDINERGQLIINQMKYLFEQDQTEILNKTKPIVEHNYNHMINTDWYLEFFKEFKQALIL